MVLPFVPVTPATRRSADGRRKKRVGDCARLAREVRHRDRHHAIRRHRRLEPGHGLPEYRDCTALDRGHGVCEAVRRAPLAREEQAARRDAAAVLRDVGDLDAMRGRDVEALEQFAKGHAIGR